MEYGVVIVSHVSEISQGVKRLIEQVAKDVPVTIAGGLENGDVGTDMQRIIQAFEDNSATKLLAFYDLGSAKMNLEMAIEMTDKEVKLYDTALVESAYTAAALLQVETKIEDVEAQLKDLKVK
ncbi:dihydroxyacetone kinase phosphoryl donor subunit DhaM [Pediococcus pentosaceus]|jgi:dihydroxyacetone kinase phosphotransfer subunit|uniref:dihydroxyacetone kinase phosphoryl donor subunit DhaM n=1 Tax=Pediococcus pentosaceus TaxID=1255 RepID=UPI000762ADA7|nr:dihydroxyacetone kinase phosphoryl donor subunit DhaM [Pediococcus pentosaceus]MBF7109195.1 PTS-dependent dihydroxyacetone kinase phosphotransferase subunit DhaM [Pediococcus pentosaceus]MCI1488572.1 PTS-dependent dihydroxyacetone kinase phosphotransferase subunit DhaM [Pediococcus pentosaceus]MCQ9195748.1 dihydroxyacetone kinase phosphoryl donor subunit DhaM [Pediococcus pentosaceus]MCQ9316845.1 dihydroxyacetone kinase phosphoryl donor subunit DhaM [Pediococcus pentosaceus]MCQ9339336.1 dih